MAAKPKKTKHGQKSRKKLKYAWVSLIWALFFWVPILNVVLFLPASILFGIKAMLMAKRSPNIYGGFTLAAISTIFASVSFMASLIILIMSISGMLNA